MRLNAPTIVHGAVTILLWGLSSPANAEADDLKERLDHCVDRFIGQGYIVGLSVGVIRGDRTLVAHYGETSLGRGVPPGDDTLYELGPLTETLTATLLAERVSKGELGLEDFAAQRLAEEANPPLNTTGPITLGQLASHTSGLPPLPGYFDGDRLPGPFALDTAEGLFATVSRIEAGSPPKATYRHSALGTALLARALEAHGQKPFLTLVRERVCVPLGMGATALDPAGEPRDRLTRGHNGEGEPLDDAFTLAGAWGIRGSLHDMLRYARAQLDPASTPLTAAITLTHQPRSPAPYGEQSALGWKLVPHGKACYAGGSAAGHGAWIAFDRERKVAVVVLANTATEWVEVIGVRLMQRAVGADLVLPRPPELPANPPTDLDRFVGDFRPGPGRMLHVTREDDRLVLHADDRPPLRLHPASDTQCYIKPLNTWVSYEFDPLGQSRRITLMHGVKEQTADRVIASPPP